MPPPPTVVDLNYTTVYGRALILDPSGTPTPVYPGSVTFTPSTVLRDTAGNAFFFPSRTFTANTDVNGNWTIDLPATDDPDINPTGWTYLVVENWAGGRTYSVGVPYNPPSGDRTVAFATIAPAPASSGVAQFGYLGPQGAQGYQGAAGPQGAVGAQGAQGSSTWTKLMPTGVIAESAWRGNCSNNTGAGLASGTLEMVSIWLPAGPIGHLGLYTGATAAVTPTHSWLALFDATRVMLAVTADAGSAAIPANTLLSYAIATIASGSSTTYTVPAEGMYYVGWLVVASTVPSLYGLAAPAGNGPMIAAPALAGGSSTGQTTPPAFPFTAAAITAAANVPYMNVAT
jgi:hypothetical protein